MTEEQKQINELSTQFAVLNTQFQEFRKEMRENFNELKNNYSKRLEIVEQEIGLKADRTEVRALEEDMKKVNGWNNKVIGGLYIVNIIIGIAVVYFRLH